MASSVIRALRMTYSRQSTPFLPKFTAFHHLLWPFYQQERSACHPGFQINSFRSPSPCLHWWHHLWDCLRIHSVRLKTCFKYIQIMSHEFNAQTPANYFATKNPAFWAKERGGQGNILDAGHHLASDLRIHQKTAWKQFCPIPLPPRSGPFPCYPGQRYQGPLRTHCQLHTCTKYPSTFFILNSDITSKAQWYAPSRADKPEKNW